MAYARQIDPSYALTLVSKEFEVNTTASQAANYKKAKGHMVKNGMPAEILNVFAPHFPQFWPKHSDAIKDLVGLEKTLIYYYWADSYWVRTDGPVTVRQNTTLYLRSKDVTDCLDGPSSSKRKLSFDNTTPSSPSPLRMPRFEESSPSRPIIKPLVLVSSALEDVIELSDSDEDDNTVSMPKSRIIKVEDSAESMSANSSSSSSTQNKTNSFPTLYFCDMDRGFRAMSSIAGNMGARFKQAFNAQTFNSSTYYDNLHLWEMFSADERNFAISKGTTAEGEWLYNASFLRLSIFKHKLLMALRSLIFGMLKPTPKNVSAGIVLCVKAAIHVDWDFIQSTEDNPARKVETFMRLLLHEGKIHLPALLSLSDSPLSSPPSSPRTAPPPRPASAMSGVEVDPATLLNPTSVADNVDTVMADRDTNEEGEGLADRDTDEEGEGQGSDGQEEEVKVKETSSWYGHIDDYDENIEWELIVFDPKVDQEIETPKIIVINYANRGAGQMSVHRFNFLRFAYHTNSPELADPSEECTARTFNATTVSAVRNALKKVWPGGVTFDVFWRLPGYSLMQEFGPVATHYAHSPGTIVWQVGPKHTIPILGPEEALRVLLVIRERYPDSDDDNDDNIQQGVAPVPTHVPANPGANIPAVPPPPYVQNPGPVIPQGQIPVQPVAPVAVPAPLIAPPVVPVVPLAQAGQNIAQINAVIVSWLERLYGEYAVVIQIRGSDKRQQQSVSKLLEWVQQVHDVRVAHARVPDNAVGAGVAVGRVISGQNIGDLFLRSQQWIKQALSVYDLYEAKKDRQPVKDLVATGMSLGLGTLQAKLTPM
ncbi:hypothetical protein C8R43DRAFT_1121430 [Mycena crocata]|nr:hypothetical protein C8R43DRAFT_1121430 [Mycena crocata]